VFLDIFKLFPEVFDNSYYFVWSVSEARQVLIDSDTSLQLSAQKITLVKEQDQLRFRQQFR